jgi:hypothetical protein
MSGDGTVEPDGPIPERADRASTSVAANLDRGGRLAAYPRRQGALLGGLVLAVAAILVGVTVFGPGVGPASTPAPSAGSAAPGAVPTTSSSAAPSPSPQEWAAAVLPSIEPGPQLVATRTGPNGTSIDTAFSLTAPSGTPAAELAKRIEVTPPILLSIEPGTSAGTALLRPTAPERGHC